MTVVIDLGEIPSEDVLADIRVPRDPRSYRLIQLIVVTVVSALLFAGSAAASMSPLRLVARISVANGTSFLVIGTRAIVADVSTTRGRLIGYDLTTGRRTWSARLPVAVGKSVVVAAQGAVLVTNNSLQGSRTIAVGAATGAIWWDHPSTIAYVVPQGIVESRTDYRDVTRELRLIDTRTGAMKWTADVPLGCQDQTSDSPADVARVGIIVACGELNRIQAIDMATGVVRASRGLDLPPAGTLAASVADRLGGPQVTVFGDLVVVTHDNYPTPTADAYRASNLERLWQGMPITGSDYLMPCAAYLCMRTEQGTMFLNPQTGAALYGMPGPAVSAPGLNDTGTAVHVGDAVGATDFIPAIVDTQIVIRPYAQIAGLTKEIEDPALSGSAVPVINEGVMTNVPYAPVAGASWVALRTVTENATGARSIRVTPLEQLAGVRPDACQQIASYLVCATSRATLSFWQLARVA